MLPQTPEEWIDFLTANGLSILGMLFIVVAITLLVWFLIWFFSRAVKRSKTRDENSDVYGRGSGGSLFWKRFKAQKRYIQIFVIVLIVFLIVADYMNIYGLFSNTNLGMPQRERVVYAILFAVLLEGVPIVLGMAHSILTNTTVYISGEKKKAKWVAALGLAVLICMFGIVIYLRLSMISYNGGKTAYYATKEDITTALTVAPTPATESPERIGARATYASLERANLYPRYIVDSFLVFSPILTSVLAFIAPIMAFKSQADKELQDDIDLLHADYINKFSEYEKALFNFKRESNHLWSGLSDKEDMPEGLDSFIRKVSVRMRRKLIVDFYTEYKPQYRRFKDEIVVLLNSYKAEMSTLSNIPTDISEIDIYKEIDLFNRINTPPSEYSWDNEDGIDDEIKRLLDNSIKIAQYKAGVTESTDGDDRFEK